MKKLIFEELLLVSRIEKAARKVVFDKKMTLIRGSNDTGKSSIIKSLYWTLGATSGKESSKWKGAKVRALLRMNIDGEKYSVFRHQDRFGIFNKSDECLGVYETVTSEFSPALAELLGIKLRLMNQKGVYETPTPAFFFLPFYIDQDVGWSAPLSSFASLQQYKNWKKDLIFYHIGVRPNDWYKLKADIANVLEGLKNAQEQLESMKGLRVRISSQMAEVSFDLDVESYKKEIDLLLKKCEQLNDAEEKYRNTIVLLESDRLRIMAQLDIVKKAQKELNLDFDFAAENLPDEVGCPICGAHYSNSFAERFNIARDQDRCLGLVEELNADLILNLEKLSKHKNSLTQTTLEAKSVRDMLSQKKSDITLDDLIKREGRKQLALSVDEEIDRINIAIIELEKERKSLQIKMRELEDPELQKKVVDYFARELRSSYVDLEVETQGDDFGKYLLKNIDDTGSDLPRKVLAYTISLQKTIIEHGSALSCPRVFDAPNQQEQDKENLTKILEFIRDRCGNDDQVIVGLVNDLDIDFPGAVIDVHSSRSILSQDAYVEASDELEGFSLQVDQGGACNLKFK